MATPIAVVDACVKRLAKARNEGIRFGSTLSGFGYRFRVEPNANVAAIRREKLAAHLLLPSQAGCPAPLHTAAYLGDAACAPALARLVRETPRLRVLVLRNNLITDRGLGPLVEALGSGARAVRLVAAANTQSHHTHRAGIWLCLPLWEVVWEAVRLWIERGQPQLQARCSPVDNLLPCRVALLPGAQRQVRCICACSHRHVSSGGLHRETLGADTDPALPSI